MENVPKMCLHYKNILLQAITEIIDATWHLPVVLVVLEKERW